MIRKSLPSDFEAIYTIINNAAIAYTHRSATHTRPASRHRRFQVKSYSVLDRAAPPVLFSSYNPQ